MDNWTLLKSKDLAILSNLEQGNLGYEQWRVYLRENNIRSVELGERVSPYIDLGEGWEAVQASFGKNLRRNLNRAKTRISKESNFELVESINADEVREALRHCYDISKVSWKGQQGADMGGSERRTRFYDLITEQAISNRLDVYNQKTAPLASFYEKAGMLMTVTATSSDTVIAAIKSKLDIK